MYCQNKLIVFICLFIVVLCFDKGWLVVWYCLGGWLC